MKETYNNKTVIITGASRGIGAKTALKFASCGYNVIINYVNNDHLAQNIQKEIVSKYNVKVTLIKADISKEEEVKKKSAY